MELGTPCGKTNNRTRILESARELFYHVGYQATSIDEILKHSGVVKSNFYYHFKSKEDLGFAVLESRVQEYQELVAHTLRNPNLPPAQRMERFFGCVSEAQNEVRRMSGCPFGNLAATLTTDGDSECDERFRQRLRLLFDDMENALRDCLAEGMEQGAWRTDIAPEDIAAFLNASIQGLLMLTKTHRDTTPLINGLKVALKLLRE